MKISVPVIVTMLAVATTGCSRQSGNPVAAAGDEEAVQEQTMNDESQVADVIIEIAPGLTARILQAGYGRAAEPGDYVDVHYTGWLYDEAAPDKRGEKFDSSIDRGQKFQFTLGAGQVIKGWDQGVTGMLIGEKRELTIAPEMGYGSRGAGNVIPPGATLVFEVELFGLEGPSDSP